MTYDWYKIINKNEFEATGLISRELNIILQGIGAKKVLVTNGAFLSITIDDVMLSINVIGKDTFTFQNRAVHLDPSGDVWYGVAIA